MSHGATSKLKSIRNSRFRVVVQSDKVVARSDRLVVVGSINSLVVARSDKQVFGDTQGDI